MPPIVHTLHTPLAVLLARSLAHTIRQAMARFQRHRAARHTERALAALDDRTLRDLGLYRCELSSVAAHADDPRRARRLRAAWSGR